ncbi:MAG: hypothetical protein IPI31_04545 [Bacteroidetes bacterium]|jgi:hypothetical protein|nr:hypothetical protein [Bacteroidota bacterium]MBK7567075.1 hypothetical protein [Bacteroidota bacterium]MBP8916589.1 hypothetical protein [Chitinophagales bacterium]MBP9190816.1 hypothetical protein [Chitinophagales bacterium]MBP9796520.1 hypothetical protein [Chitinophagales bacterium]
MKSCVLTFVLVVCVLSGIKSQTIGLKINPIATTTNFSEEYGWGFGSGIFYDHNIYKRLGFSSGIFFTQLREVYINVFCWSDLEHICPNKVDERYDIIEIPINLSLDFSNAVDSKWKFLAYTGFSYGFVVNKDIISYYDDYKLFYEENDYNKHLFFFNAGCEIRHTINKKIVLSLGSQYQFIKPELDSYEWMQSCNIYFKAGVNLDAIKANNQ